MKEGVGLKRKHSGLLFISPWLVGLLLFTVFPMIAAIYISLTNWPIIGEHAFIGVGNYLDIFKDESFWKSLKITVTYAALAIPLSIITAFIIAMLLNTNIKGLSIYRTAYYLPAIVSGVAVAIVWRWILNPDFGLINIFLKQVFNVEGPAWLYDTKWVLPSYILIAVWGAGGGMLTYLVGLKDIPKDLYESAEMDGAGFFTRLFKITIPFMTPILYYNLIMGTIASFRKFTDAYILGGAGGRGKYYMVYLYENAFAYYKMGYATALAWILFIIILSLTLFVNYTSKKWMYTEVDK